MIEKPKTGTVTVDEQILVSAVRYALPRQTYMVDETIKAVLFNIKHLSKKALSAIYLDIAKMPFDPEGDMRDQHQWATLANTVAKEIEKV